MKQRICAALGALGGALSAAFGGWDAAMTALVALMGADYVTGVLVAGVFLLSFGVFALTQRKRKNVPA